MFMITSLKTVIFTLEWVIKDLVECLFIACSRRSDSGAGTVNIESREKTRRDSGETAKELTRLSPQSLLVFSAFNLFPFLAKLSECLETASLFIVCDHKLSLVFCGAV